MRLKANATALALAVVAAIGYGIYERKELGRQQQASAPTPATKSAQPPAPFAVADRLGYTPGDDVARYVALATPTAAFDAWSLINACEHAERYAQSDAAARCNGITQEHRRAGGALLSAAMMAGVHGAAVEYARAIMGVPRDELVQGRRDNPDLDKAVSTVVQKLEEAAPRDRGAIRVLARLYRRGNAITGERNAAKALVYVTAEHELVPTPGFEKSRRMSIDDLTAGLTPEEVKRAREAGLQLARNCDCKED